MGSRADAVESVVKKSEAATRETHRCAGALEGWLLRLQTGTVFLRSPQQPEGRAGGRCNHTGRGGRWLRVLVPVFQVR